LLFLNRSYYPDAEATGQLLTELCEDLASDFDVTVIAGQPNQNPLAAPFRRYGREVHRGVTIHRDGWFTRWLRRAFVAAYRRADRVVVLSDDMRRVLLEADLEEDRIATIPNWVDTRRVAPHKSANAFRQELGVADKFVVMYSGNLGLCQDLDTVLRAAAQLRDHKQIVFLLVGDGAHKPRLLRMAAELCLQNVRFVDYQPQSRLAESLSAADVHLVPVDARVSRYLMPSKLYGILASGTPLIAATPHDSELARLVEEQRVGAVVEPGDPQALAERILWFVEWSDDLAGYGRRARDLAVHRFDRRHSVDRFRHLLYSLAEIESAAEPQIPTPASEPLATSP